MKQLKSKVSHFFLLCSRVANKIENHPSRLKSSHIFFFYVMANKVLGSRLATYIRLRTKSHLNQYTLSHFRVENPQTLPHFQFQHSIWWRHIVAER